MERAPHQIDEGLFALQPLVWPQPLHPAQGLTLRREGEVALEPGALVFQPGGVVRLNTACNIFPLAKWQRHCGISDLRLVLLGEGRLRMTLTGETAALPVTTTQDISLPAHLDLPPQPPGVQILHLAFEALEPARLTAVTWATSDAPKRLPRLALSVTTFRREAAARATISRFARDRQGSALAPFLTLQVIDNGQSLKTAAPPGVRILPNRNLGGAGGFARGLSEARAAGASHCVFMDDDASVGFDAIARTWTFLAHSTDPRTAVAGALMSAAKPTRLWENGALFDEVCKPLSHLRDLAVASTVRRVEEASLKPRKANFYGGFWYFAFPLQDLRQGIFPFFVRGDDISFCIANQFNAVTLPGVMCFQDVDFSEKENSLTLYLDLRSHLIHHLTLPVLDRGRKIASVPLRYFRRALGQHHLDTLLTLNWAIEDVLAGPEAFAAEPDAATRRAAIAAARRHEIWHPLAQPPEVRRRFNPKRRWQRLCFGLALNGALLPFFDRWGDRITLPQFKRGFLRSCWGAARVTYVSRDGTRAMTLRHDKRIAWAMGLRMAWNIARLVVTYPRLRDRWRAGYARIATEAWWQDQFNR